MDWINLCLGIDQFYALLKAAMTFWNKKLWKFLSM